jgi:hypothetical protein
VILRGEEWTGRGAGEQHRFPLRLNLLDHLEDRLPSVMTVGLDKPWLTEHVKVVSLNDERSLAARATLVAFVGVHG